MKRKYSMLALQIQTALVAATVGLSPAALAQESDKAKQDDQQLERIMVTAQKTGTEHPRSANFGRNFRRREI